MNSWFGKILLGILGALFLLRGGFSILLAFWRFLLPMILIGGGYYLLKKAIADQKRFKVKEKKTAPTFKARADGEEKVIHICPHCLQEWGSCPQCLKSQPENQA